jgi:hypothetical protein
MPRLFDARPLEDWHIEEDGFDAVRDGLTRTYRRGRKAMATAFESPNGENFHAWRKHAKYHWYHTRLLERVWRSELHPRRAAAKELGEALGEHHDLAVLRAQLADGDRARDRKFIDRRAEELTVRARIIGERLYAGKPKAFSTEFEGWWQARLDEIVADRGGAPDRPGCTRSAGLRAGPAILHDKAGRVDSVARGSRTSDTTRNAADETRRHDIHAHIAAMAAVEIFYVRHGA